MRILQDLSSSNHREKNIIDAAQTVAKTLVDIDLNLDAKNIMKFKPDISVIYT